MGCGATKGNKYASTGKVPGAEQAPDSLPVIKVTVPAEPAEPEVNYPVFLSSGGDASPSKELNVEEERVGPSILKEVFDTALLCHLEADAMSKCEELSISDLGALLEKEAVFSSALGLKPLERKRLRKALGRTGDSVLLEPLTPVGSDQVDSPQVCADFLPEDVMDRLLEAQLEHLRANASSWCEKTGAALLEEVCEHAVHFSDFLSLAQDERNRLFIALRILPPDRRVVVFVEEGPALSSPPAPQKLGRTATSITISSTRSADCLIELFMSFDKDSTGVVSPQELRHWLSSLGGDPLTDEETEEMLKLAAPNDDGMIDYADFVNSLTTCASPAASKMWSTTNSLATSTT